MYERKPCSNNEIGMNRREKKRERADEAIVEASKNIKNNFFASERASDEERIWNKL
jgi:hypothetical protein